MNICEMQLYAYMTKLAPNHKNFIDMIKRAMLSKQRCNLNNAHASARMHTFARMSGDMCTSLGNGFTNLMVMNFISHLKGWNECVGIVEGDDGLFRISGEVPTSEEFAQLGFTIKAEIHREIGEAGFCQIFCTEELHNLVDPRKILLRGGWTTTSSMHKKELGCFTRAKAFSLICEAPRNPITVSMGKWLLRATRGKKHHLSWDEGERWWME
jgi:hypothetical protein